MCALAVGHEGVNTRLNRIDMIGKFTNGRATGDNDSKMAQVFRLQFLRGLCDLLFKTDLSKLSG